MRGVANTIGSMAVLASEELDRAGYKGNTHHAQGSSSIAKHQPQGLVSLDRIPQDLSIPSVFLAKIGEEDIWTLNKRRGLKLPRL